MTYLREDPVEKLEILAARLPPSIVKGSFSGTGCSPSWPTHEARSYVKRPSPETGGTGGRDAHTHHKQRPSVGSTQLQ